MKILQSRSELALWRQKLSPAKKLGLVPTMGALHAGHGSLVSQSVADNEDTLVTIFVNPTQFGPDEDLDRYPRDLEGDLALLAQLGATAVFAPPVSEIYPQGPSHITFAIHGLDDRLCGASRPGHMNGVLQIVTILFHLTRPDRAYFGLKDYQQYRIIQTLVEELYFPLEIRPCPIVREDDGLAMSSRNRYLEGAYREQALFLQDTLQRLRAAREQLCQPGTLDTLLTAQQARYPLARLDYLEILDGRTLSPPAAITPEQAPVAFIAAYLGDTRLIDNLPLWDYPVVSDL
ncbi:MAG: pantoate--beta-alanine ligase [Bacteroidetes bacterium]|nr:MAG: pantoate--beta-alanine ligase [Bacteroidota bacterium]